MIYVFLILLWVFWGFVCFNMAKKRGRNTVLGFFAGFFFGLFAVIYYSIVGETEDYKSERIQRIVSANK